MSQVSENFTISVSALTQEISRLLRDEIGDVQVSGEISGFKVAASGHRYFTLKDEQAQIDCVLWSSKLIDCELTDGMRVVIKGKVTIYPSRGKYQIDCQTVTAAGLGDLYLAFAALKANLAEQGYFESERKKALPQLPLRIGVVTSPTGAALQDILTTLRRRSPFCQVYFCPATVQGESAAREVANAIYTLAQTDCEVIIVGRGGGSIEDLWAFNTFPVAQAIYNSAIPIVSAVGHETDFTISDFVADVRAATPTAAAELVTQMSKQKLMDYLSSMELDMYGSVKSFIHTQNQRIERSTNSYAFQALPEKLHNYSQRIDESELRLRSSLERGIQTVKTKLMSVEAHLQSLHPLSPLQRGFALLRTQERFVRNDESLKSFKQVEILRQDETVSVSIDKVKSQYWQS